MLSIALGVFEALFSAFLKAFFSAREQAAARADLDQAHERAGAAEAANETQQAISEIADARSKVNPDTGDPADLARRLRARADAIRAGRLDPGGAGAGG